MLNDDRLIVTGKYRLTHAGGKPFPRGTRVFGPGAQLHFLIGDAWYKLGIDDLPGG